DDLAARPPAVVAAVGLTLAIATLRFPLGRPPLSWEDRLGRLVDGARALASGPGDDRGARDAYARALAALPAGARIGLWVDRPDLVDYRGRAIVDLRTPALAACTGAVPRGTRWFAPPLASCRRLAALLPTLQLDDLVVAAAALPRPDAWIDRPWCFLFTPDDCIDPITRWVGVDRRRNAGAVDVIRIVDVVDVRGRR
ncbi:MAG TPA: hypothetical protein VHE35_08100, partial [Kofleriaceae bacterium]|nr:hypothetical protein [Kofleriaceae bacterium]